MVSWGDAVVFVDHVGVEHVALVTDILDASLKNLIINLVYVSSDPLHRNVYGLDLIHVLKVPRVSVGLSRFYWMP